MSITPAIQIRYSFMFQDGREIDHTIRLDPETYENVASPKSEIPFWCEINYSKCSHCQLKSDEMTACPVAMNFVDIAEKFKSIASFEIVDVIVTTEERTYVKQTVPVQKGLSSLFGIIMVTSGCRDLDKLRPMVKFHLPFATIEETIYRVASMYQLAQYFRVQHGLEQDTDMDQLVRIYEKINIINSSLCHRLQKATEVDANMNAVVILDVFSQMVSLKIQENLVEFEGLFAPYLK